MSLCEEKGRTVVEKMTDSVYYNLFQCSDVGFMRQFLWSTNINMAFFLEFSLMQK